jgi:hypothetical protein
MSYGISTESLNLCEKYPVIEKFCDFLHGSGIDYDWYIEDKKESIICYNSYHTMDENGFYDRVIGFKVIFPKLNLYDFTVKCTDDRYGYEKYALNQYLPDQVYYAISESIKSLKEEWPIKSGIRLETICKIFPVKIEES